MQHSLAIHHMGNKDNPERTHLQEHGNRTLRETGLNFDASLTPYNEKWIDIPCKDFYKNFFKQSIIEYNNKQKRKDRRIKNYYEDIERNKDKNNYYEITFKLDRLEHKDLEEYQKTEPIFKNSCKEFAETFEKRYPNFKVIGAYYHIDEDGTNHMHLDYVPIGYNCNQGMKIQTSMRQALKEMNLLNEESKNQIYLDKLRKDFTELFETNYQTEMGKAIEWETEKPKRIRAEKNLNTKDYKQKVFNDYKESLEKRVENGKATMFKKQTEDSKKAQEELNELNKTKFDKGLEMVANAKFNELKTEHPELMEKMKTEYIEKNYSQELQQLQDRELLIKQNEELKKKREELKKELAKKKNEIVESDKNKNEIERKIRELETEKATKNNEIEKIKNEIKELKPTLTELQKQEVKKQVESQTKELKTDYETKLKKINDDNSTSYHSLYQEERRKNIMLENENNELKSTLRAFYKHIKDFIGSSFKAVMQVFKKFNPNEHETLEKTISKEEKKKGFELD